jgi:hypothetical protein
MSTTPYFDSVLGITSSILAYLFIFPVIYIIAEVIVPRKYAAVSKDGVDLTKSVKRGLSVFFKKQRKSLIMPIVNSSILPANESEIRTNDEVGTFEIQSSKTSYVRLCSRFFGICFRRITTFFSFEIWLAKMSEYWVVHLSTKFNADLDEVLNYNN